MIRVEPVSEPESFDAEVRRKGKAWLEEHPTGRPPALWIPYSSDLEAGFHGRCGYAAMKLVDGTVDHYRSCTNHRHLAFEWQNYRFASARINSVKGAADDRVLDPFEVGDDWFEIQLPSLQMIATDRIPPEQRDRADFTLDRLKLRAGPQLIRQRSSWYSAFLKGGLSLAGLYTFTPMIARAVEKRLQRIELRETSKEALFRSFLASERTLLGIAKEAPGLHELVLATLRAPA